MKVLVGLSGGVDSAVAAYLLKAQGYDVTCAFMRNWDSFTNNDILGNPTIMDDMCSQEVDYNDAKKVADHLGLPLLRVDYVKDYWDNVFTTFISETEKGYTPNPDILCNKYVKFDAFYDFMEQEGFDALATGHYAQIINNTLVRGLDGNKDQTYFLSRINPSVLSHVLFPLGNMTKQEVRKIAIEQNIPVATKKDSTGICFIGERHYREFLKNYVKDREGDILDFDTGTVVGRHNGVMFYTIGQRHGLDISGAMGPWFVVGKDMSTNNLYVGRGSDHPELFAYRCVIDDVNWFGSKHEGLMDCTAKFRYRQPDQPVSIRFIDATTLEVLMPKGVKAVTLGQEAVFYHDEVCLGGGRIARVFNKDDQEVLYDSSKKETL
ncbi:tRNA-specific 2-thiouridylase [Erysipelothrix larvae]|uniref:tRNA-specific 2-thiouridylase MnmA n=1 Tax=Erysipelothrix larvae TaxID=1514105 RepID=A0A109UGU6_9FIRM|nr:tRNA 2-thiouridine(34) synthase MnmA [Erysipelothrix larvae]AMC93238.1 tRNA-specific 2-thiouridylase [Erysipelothrix larvae]